METWSLKFYEKKIVNFSLPKRLNSETPNGGYSSSKSLQIFRWIREICKLRERRGRREEKRREKEEGDEEGGQGKRMRRNRRRVKWTECFTRRFSTPPLAIPGGPKLAYQVVCVCLWSANERVSIEKGPGRNSRWACAVLLKITNRTG